MAELSDYIPDQRQRFSLEATVRKSLDTNEINSVIDELVTLIEQGHDRVIGRVYDKVCSNKDFDNLDQRYEAYIDASSFVNKWLVQRIIDEIDESSILDAWQLKYGRDVAEEAEYQAAPDDDVEEDNEDNAEEE